MAATRTAIPSLLLLLFSSVSTAVHCRLFLSSDDGLNGPPYLLLSRASATLDVCKQTFGFMPCSTTWIGNLFLILVYAYLMYVAATYLSAGSELLLEISSPRIVGGLFLPMLGALPDAILILVSGLSDSTETAQDQVSVGMGLLAGSTVMLITVIWGLCVVVGKCDIQDYIAVDKQDTKGFSLTGSGVTTDIWTSYAARIMVVSLIPFMVVQLPEIFSSSSGRPLAVLAALIVSILLLIGYCLYQAFQPWIQRRKLAYLEHKHVIFRFLRHLRKRTLGRLLRDDGEVNKDVVEKLFKAIDENGDGYLSAAELKALIVGIRFEEVDLDEDDAVTKIMNDFDSSKDFKLDLNEFTEGVTRWLNHAINTGAASAGGNVSTIKYLDFAHHQVKQEHKLLRTDDGDEVVSEELVKDRKRTTLKAVFLLITGTAIVGVFANPLIDAVDNFSDATSIPSFFISFVVLPLATNSGEAVSAIIFASRKKQRTASLTFSELYGAVAMNNILCLAVFLGLVYVRGLTWDFTAEVLVIIITCVVMGLFASFRTTFPLWTSFVAFSLYPCALGLVYVFDYILGWS